MGLMVMPWRNHINSVGWGGEYSNLNKHSPVDHGQGGRDEHLGMGSNFFTDEKHESECYSTPQPPVHHDELLRPVELLDPVPVGHV